MKAQKAMTTALLAAMATMSWSTAGAYTLFYSNDFQGTIGSEWKFQSEIDEAWTGPSDPTQTPAIDGDRQFLGEFIGGETASLNLAGLPDHDRLLLSFDLFIIRSWDGEGTDYGKDYFNVTYGVDDDVTLFRESFANGNPGGQSYSPNGPGVWPERTGAAEVNTLGYVFSSWIPGVEWEPTVMDSVYRIAFDFAHSDPLLTLNFFAEGLQTYIREDESWGLDNVSLAWLKKPTTAVPEPGVMALLACGLLAMGWLRGTASQRVA